MARESAQNHLGMSPLELEKKIKVTADRLESCLPSIDRPDLELILWNLFREKKNPVDFILKKVGEGYAR